VAAVVERGSVLGRLKVVFENACVVPGGGGKGGKCGVDKAGVGRATHGSKVAVGQWGGGVTSAAWGGLSAKGGGDGGGGGGPGDGNSEGSGEVLS